MRKDNDQKVRVGLVQMRCAEDPGENMAKAMEMTRRAVDEGAQVVCLPELFRSRYFCQTEDPAHDALGLQCPEDDLHAEIEVLGQRLRQHALVDDRALDRDVEVDHLSTPASLNE